MLVPVDVGFNITDTVVMVTAPPTEIIILVPVFVDVILTATIIITAFPSPAIASRLQQSLLQST